MDMYHLAMAKVTGNSDIVAFTVFESAILMIQVGNVEALSRWGTIYGFLRFVVHVMGSNVGTGAVLPVVVLCA